MNLHLLDKITGGVPNRVGFIPRQRIFYDLEREVFWRKRRIDVVINFFFVKRGLKAHQWVKIEPVTFLTLPVSIQ